MRQQVLLNWKASNTFGWGLLGLGIGLHWANDPAIQPLMGFPMGPNDFPGLDAIRAMALRSVAPASNQFLTDLSADRVSLRERRVLVIDALSNGFMGPNLQHRGIHNIGRCVFEDTRLSEAGIRLAKYDSLLCASHWNAGLLRAVTDKPVTMIHEGIDDSQFFPGPRSGLLDPGRFYIFSGGKIEFRKGHDLVLLAFREFAARHDDAVLAAAWHSPWPEVSAGFRGKLNAPLTRGAHGELDIARWVAENGIAERQFVELPRMPNSMLPAVLREMDCAVQVSRCEPCTNLPAKEAMACGVPVILSDNTGTRDLIDADNCVTLRSQGFVHTQPAADTDGWGESDVDEIVAAMELLYTDSERRTRIGNRGAQWILEQRRTWRDHAATLKNHLLGLGLADFDGSTQPMRPAAPSDR
jgi:glycosyltransferase involved in cell wall biosynthesis